VASYYKISGDLDSPDKVKILCGNNPFMISGDQLGFLRIKPPRITLPKPKIKIKTPRINIRMPETALPKFKMPSLNMRVPNIRLPQIKDPFKGLDGGKFFQGITKGLETGIQSTGQLAETAIMTPFDTALNVSDRILERGMQSVGRVADIAAPILQTATGLLAPQGQPMDQGTYEDSSMYDQNAIYDESMNFQDPSISDMQYDPNFYPMETLPENDFSNMNPDFSFDSYSEAEPDMNSLMGADEVEERKYSDSFDTGEFGL
jgi:hypothetical protein